MHNNKYMKYYGKNEANLHGCSMLQKLPVKNFKWLKDIIHIIKLNTHNKNYTHEKVKAGSQRDYIKSIRLTETLY